MGTSWDDMDILGCEETVYKTSSIWRHGCHAVGTSSDIMDISIEMVGYPGKSGHPGICIDN